MKSETFVVDVMDYKGFDDAVLGPGRSGLDGIAAVVEEENIQLGGVEMENLTKGMLRLPI